MPIIRSLLDNHVPIRLIPLLRPHEAMHASKVGWPTIRDNVTSPLAAIATITPGSYTMVTFPRSPLRRRPYPEGPHQ